MFIYSYFSTVVGFRISSFKTLGFKLTHDPKFKNSVKNSVIVIFIKFETSMTYPPIPIPKVL